MQDYPSYLNDQANAEREREKQLAVLNDNTDDTVDIRRTRMTANQTLKDTYIKEILSRTPYTQDSGKYPMLQKDLRKLTTETLFILKTFGEKQEVK